MCLIISITADGIPRREAGLITRRVEAAGAAHLGAVRQRKSATGSRYYLGHGCACEFLSDDADWNEPYFQLDRSQTDAIEQTLTILRDAGGDRPMTARAEWAGKPAPAPHSASSLNFADLLRDIRQARIANAVSYVIA